MTVKHVILGSTIVILAVANLAYWWPDDIGQNNANYGVSPVYTQTVSLDGFHALKYLPSTESQAKRDLFLPVVPKKVVQSVPKYIQPVVSKVEEPVPVTKNNIAPTDHLIHYRLAGIAVKNGERVAYLLDGETPLVAYTGDNLSQSVAIESIGEQTAVIKDLQSGSTRKLLLVGK